MGTVTPTPRTALRWDYAPAPESRDAASLRPSYDLFIGGAFVAPSDGAASRRSTRRPRSRSPRSPSPARATSPRAVEAARAAARAWAALPPLERGKYLFRIARLIQERARELAVVESLDGGKPIRESRDVDVPLAAAHFFSYAGWADKLGYALGGPRRRAARRRRADRAVELPAADGRVEARARAGVREHGGAQAGRDDAADRAAAGRDLPGGRAARRAS